MSNTNNISSQEERELATKTAMFLADRLNSIGIHTELVSQEQAQEQLHNHADSSEFSVADIQKLNYEWNGDSISLKVFAQTFGELIKQKDRTMEDVDRIAKAYIESVKANPSAFVPQLKAENMSHWRYFVLNDGSVYTPEHMMANSPEYSTQRGLWEIYNRVLGDRINGFVDMMRRWDTLSPSEKEDVLEMEREVSGSALMQNTLETNAAKVNEQRNRDIANLIQYFENNSDYTYAEKALILKGSMTYSYSEKKKDGGRNEVKLVRITDANDVAIPVLGGEAASIVEGLRKGLNFKDSLVLARNTMDDSHQRSVRRDFTGWKRYPKSEKEEDVVMLNKDAAGTGWCTGGAISTARTHLSGGDFHIYFENGEPLIAIRTEDGRLAEPPRGAHDGQFCTSREEVIAFDYIQEGHGITGGQDYIADMLDLRVLNDPEASWMDIIRIPLERRYKNGYGDNTRSWGEAAERRIAQIMSDSQAERFAAGYYTPQEIAEYNIPHENVIGLLNDSLFTFVDNSWKNLQYIKGSIVISENVHLDLPACISIGGNVTAEKNTHLGLPACTSIGGVRAKQDSTINLPACTSVGGNVFACENAIINLSACTSVGWCVDAYENAQLNLPTCTRVGGNVDAHENAQLDLPTCARVGGGVCAFNNAQLNLPACISVGRTVRPLNNAQLNLPACTSVGGDVEAHENAQLDLSACARIGGGVSVCYNAQLNLPACISVGRLVVAFADTRVDLPACTSVGGSVKACENAHLNLPACTSVGGSVNAYNYAWIDLSACTSVGGNVYAEKKTYLNLPSKNDYHLSNGTIYGYEYNNTIYLTPEGINPNTPIHEYTHLWAKAMQVTNPAMWANIKETLKATEGWNIIAAREDYAFLRDDENRLAGEVLATMVGDNAEKLLTQIAADSLGTSDNENERLNAVINGLKERISEYVTKDLFELSGENNHLDIDTLTLGVLHSLVEQRELQFIQNTKRTEQSKNKKTMAQNALDVKITLLQVLIQKMLYSIRETDYNNLPAMRRFFTTKPEDTYADFPMQIFTSLLTDKGLWRSFYHYDETTKGIHPLGDVYTQTAGFKKVDIREDVHKIYIHLPIGMKGINNPNIFLDTEEWTMGDFLITIDKKSQKIEGFNRLENRGDRYQRLNQEAVEGLKYNWNDISANLNGSPSIERINEAIEIATRYVSQIKEENQIRKRIKSSFKDVSLGEILSEMSLLWRQMNALREMSFTSTNNEKTKEYNEKMGIFAELLRERLDFKWANGKYDDLIYYQERVTEKINDHLRGEDAYQPENILAIQELFGILKSKSYEQLKQMQANPELLKEDVSKINKDAVSLLSAFRKEELQKTYDFIIQEYANGVNLKQNERKHDAESYIEDNRRWMNDFVQVYNYDFSDEVINVMLYEDLMKHNDISKECEDRLKTYRPYSSEKSIQSSTLSASDSNSLMISDTVIEQVAEIIGEFSVALDNIVPNNREFVNYSIKESCFTAEVKSQDSPSPLFLEGDIKKGEVKLYSSENGKKEEIGFFDMNTKSFNLVGKLLPEDISHERSRSI